MKNKKLGYLKIIIAVFLILSFLFALFCSYVAMMRTVHSVAQSQMEQIANEAIHNAIYDVSCDVNKYGELVDIYRNDEGTIKSLSLNAYAVNKLKSDISLKVLDYLNKDEKYIIEVPLGNFFASEFLSGFGPKVKIKIIPFNVAAIDFESKFTQAGINQVLHTVVVKVNVEIGAILPCYEDICDVSSSAVISESIIIGDVPHTYFDIYK